MALVDNLKENKGGEIGSYLSPFKHPVVSLLMIFS